MPSYIPEYVYSFKGWDAELNPSYGLLPWPKHLQPREPERDIQLTKKGESYVQAALAEANGVFFLTLDRRDRTSIATTIERLINLLDAMEPDPDLEPSIGGWLGGGTAHDECEIDYVASGGRDGFADDEPTMGSQNDYHGGGNQEHWASGFESWDEAEVVSEDEGACIQSQPHDELDEGNHEPFLGWPETCGQGPKIGIDANPNDFTYDPQEYSGAPLRFDGDGCVAGRRVLRNLRTLRPDVPQDYASGWRVDGNQGALRVEGLTIKSNKGCEPVGHDELTILHPGVPMLKASDFDRLPWA